MVTNTTPVFSVGAIVFAFGAVLFFMKVYVGWNGVVATATVTSIRERSETDSTNTKTYYYEPSIWFITQVGDTVKDFFHDNKDMTRYKIGQQIRIIYKKDDVNEFYAATSFLWYFLFGAITISGIAVMYFSTKLKSEKWD